MTATIRTALGAVTLVTAAGLGVLAAAAPADAPPTAGSGPGVAAPVVLLASRTSPSGPALTAAATCRGARPPVVRAVGQARPHQLVDAVLSVNDRVGARGRVRADGAGRYSLQARVPNHRTSRLLLLTSGRPALRGSLLVSCPDPAAPTPVAPAAAPARAAAAPRAADGGTPASAAPADSAPAASSPAAPAPAAPAPASSAPAAPAASAPAPSSGGAPAPGSEVPVAPAGGTARGSASSYAVSHNNNGTVTRWNPCDGPIHVMINSAHAPAGAVHDAVTALGKVEEASGLRFVYDGTTSDVPTATGTQSAPLLIAWAARGTGAGQTDLFTPGAVGEGGWHSSGSSDDGTHWTWKIVSGFVVIDPTAYSQLSPGFGSGTTRGALLLHELGHAVGLDHSGDQSQVMYPTLTSSASGTYGAGDRAGLSLVGAGQGCVTAA